MCQCCLVFHPHPTCKKQKYCLVFKSTPCNCFHIQLHPLLQIVKLCMFVDIVCIYSHCNLSLWHDENPFCYVSQTVKLHIVYKLHTVRGRTVKHTKHTNFTHASLMCSHMCVDFHIWQVCFSFHIHALRVLLVFCINSCYTQEKCATYVGVIPCLWSYCNYPELNRLHTHVNALCSLVVCESCMCIHYLRQSMSLYEY